MIGYKIFNTFLLGAGVVLAKTAVAHELPLYVFEQPKPVQETVVEQVVEPMTAPEPMMIQTQPQPEPMWGEATPLSGMIWPTAPEILSTSQPVIETMALSYPVVEPQPIMATPVATTLLMPSTVETTSQSENRAPVQMENAVLMPAPVPEPVEYATPLTPVEMIDIEMPFRCATDVSEPQNFSTTLALKKGDFELTPVQDSDPLPRFEVNGYTFHNEPVDEALQTLLTEAGIAVFSQDDVYPSLSATDVYGELSAVVDELTATADTFYQYDAVAKELLLKRKVDFLVTVPNNRLVMLGVLDALRGAGIDTVVPDWGTGRMALTLTRTEQEKVQKILHQMVVDGHLLLADIVVYQTGVSNWNALLEQFGLKRVLSVTDGLNGKLLTLKRPDMNAFLNTLSFGVGMTPVSSGNLVVPNGWKMRFDIGKCASFAGADFSLQIQQRLRDIDMVDTTITVKSNNEEISSFKTMMALDNELAVIGLKDNVLGSEWLMTFKLKMIRLVKEK